MRKEKWGKRPGAAKCRKATGRSKNGQTPTCDETPITDETAENAAGGAAGVADEAASKASNTTKRNTKKDVPKPADLLKRVYGAIAKELRKLNDQTGTTSQDRERGSRALSQIMNSFEKAVKMQKKVEKKRGGNKRDKETLQDAEAMRRKIAERLEHLHRERLAAQ